MSRATTPTRSIAAVVAAAILALVLSLLGVAYLAIGLAGGPQAFTVLGAVFVAAGFVLDGVWWRLGTRARGAPSRPAAPVRLRDCGRPTAARTPARAARLPGARPPRPREGRAVTEVTRDPAGTGAHDRRLASAAVEHVRALCPTLIATLVAVARASTDGQDVDDGGSVRSVTRVRPRTQPTGGPVDVAP